MPGLFLSYRRDDTADDARRIHARLVDQFGEELVYLDVEDIPLGVDFVDHITEALETASYVLVAIGPKWLLVTDKAGRKRLENEKDPVRYEIRLALQGKRLVVPMLIGGAEMPERHELPEDIRPLVRRNGLAIRPDPDFEADVDALLSGLHLDRIDKKRVPMVFRVSHVARDLGLGGGLGWGIFGAVFGLLTKGIAGLLLATLAGTLAGMAGGGLVGWLSGLLIRHKAPPLVAADVRKMGFTWAMGLIVSIVLAGVAGYFVGMDAQENVFDGITDPSQIIGAFIIGIVAFVLLFALLLIAGLIFGSGLTAFYFARKLRLRSEEISRWRGLVIGLVWMIGGLLTVVVFVGLMGALGDFLK